MQTNNKQTYLRAVLFYKIVIEPKGAGNFQDYLLLAEWLDCYVYILPLERKIDKGLLDELYNYFSIGSKEDLISLSALVSVLTTTIPLESQIILRELLITKEPISFEPILYKGKYMGTINRVVKFSS